MQNNKTYRELQYCNSKKTMAVCSFYTKEYILSPCFQGQTLYSNVGQFQDKVVHKNRL